MGRKSNAKERLLAAALELIWENSYGGVTIDNICARAGVKKGSFYYFFDSKCALAVSALEEMWRQGKAEKDEIFSPSRPPLERLREFFRRAYEKQVEIKNKTGKVLGCPLFTLGSEISTQEGEICGKIKEIIERYQKYLETAIRDAHAEGLVNAPDAKQKAVFLFAYFEGMLTQARIQNNAELLREVPESSLYLLGVRPSALTEA